MHTCTMYAGTFPLTLDTSQFSTERHVLTVNATFPNGVVRNSFGFSGCGEQLTHNYSKKKTSAAAGSPLLYCLTLLVVGTET